MADGSCKINCPIPKLNIMYQELNHMIFPVYFDSKIERFGLNKTAVVTWELSKTGVLWTWKLTQFFFCLISCAQSSWLYTAEWLVFAPSKTSLGYTPISCMMHYTTPGHGVSGVGHLPIVKWRRVQSMSPLVRHSPRMKVGHCQPFVRHEEGASSSVTLLTCAIIS